METTKIVDETGKWPTGDAHLDAIMRNKAERAVTVIVDRTMAFVPFPTNDDVIKCLRMWLETLGGDDVAAEQAWLRLAAAAEPTFSSRINRSRGLVLALLADQIRKWGGRP